MLNISILVSIFDFINRNNIKFQCILLGCPSGCYFQFIVLGLMVTIKLFFFCELRSNFHSQIKNCNQIICHLLRLWFQILIWSGAIQCLSCSNSSIFTKCFTYCYCRVSGIILGIEDFDEIWPDSKWRCLKVVGNQDQSRPSWLLIVVWLMFFR
jgi:hypothetical protein